nr:MAG TPA: hypothetical protein [Caudoviricetes sp.]
MASAAINASPMPCIRWLVLWQLHAQRLCARLRNLRCIAAQSVS